MVLLDHRFINFLLFNQINNHFNLLYKFSINKYKIKLMKKIWFLNNFYCKNNLVLLYFKIFKTKNINNKIYFWLFFDSSFFLFNCIFYYNVVNSNTFNYLTKQDNLSLVFKSTNFLFLINLNYYYFLFFLKFFNLNFFLIKLVLKNNFIKKSIFKVFLTKKNKILQTSCLILNQNLLQLNYKVI